MEEEKKQRGKSRKKSEVLNSVEGGKKSYLLEVPRQ
jgi:hypothetical protein